MIKGKITFLYRKAADISIFIKIVCLLNVIMFVTVLSISTIVVKNFSELAMDKEVAVADIKIDVIANYMNEKYNRIYSISNYIHSGSIAGIMSKINQEADPVYHIEDIKYLDVFFRAVSSADEDISDIILCSNNGGMYSYTKEGYPSVKPSYSFMASKNARELIKMKVDMRITSANTNEYAIKERGEVLTFLGKIYDTAKFPQKEMVGIYMINIPIDRVHFGIQTDSLDMKGYILVLNKEQRIVFSTDKSRQSGVYEKPSNDKIYANTRAVGTSGLTVVYTLDKKALFREIGLVKQKIIWFVIIFILASLMISWMVSMLFKKRVGALILYMHKIQKGDFEYRLDVRSHDEIGVLSEEFNKMSQQLKTYIDQVYYSEIERKNAELDALQTQINPHFLYNTLESIKAAALEEHAQNAAEMVRLLGNLFRWSCNTKDKIVILEDEIEYVKTYFKLQSYRFKEPFEIDIKVPDELLDYGIPQLILQPVVENIIKHGFTGQKRKGLIGIHAKQKDCGNIEITIFDNGNGMGEERLNQINEMLDVDKEGLKGGSIGIKNVSRRLQLIFGSSYRLEIQSILGMGTSVKVKIPALTKEEMEQIV